MTDFWQKSRVYDEWKFFVTKVCDNFWKSGRVFNFLKLDQLVFCLQFFLSWDVVKLTNLTGGWSFVSTFFVENFEFKVMKTIGRLEYQGFSSEFFSLSKNFQFEATVLTSRGFEEEEYSSWEFASDFLDQQVQVLVLVFMQRRHLPKNSRAFLGLIDQCTSVLIGFLVYVFRDILPCKLWMRCKYETRYRYTAKQEAWINNCTWHAFWPTPSIGKIIPSARSSLYSLM